MKKLYKSILLAFLSVGLSFGFAQIGQPVETLEESLESYRPIKTVMGYFVGADFQYSVEERNGLVYTVSAEGTLNETNIPLASDLIGYASGYGAGMADPVKEFFNTRVSELAGQGEVPLAVEQYVLRINVTGDAAPYNVEFSLELFVIDESLFPIASNTLGPADAKHVIREFSDFQCPFCARFSNTALPAVKEQLLTRGDVRFEFHHFPLTSIHANAMPSAEAAECVVASNNPEAFWPYHDALFVRQQAWQNLPDATGYFVRLAQDIGLNTEGMEQCIQDGLFKSSIEAGARAAGELGIRGTPTVYVNGYKVGDFNDISNYLNLIEISEKFAE